MDFQKRIDDMGKGPFFLAIVAAVLSAGAIITSISPAMDGETYGYTHLGLGVLGLIGSGLLMFGKDFGKMGWMVLAAWALIQTAYYATEPDGNYTRQLFDGLLGLTQQASVNGELTNYEEIGINIVGGIMAIWTFATRKRLDLWKRIAS